MGEGRDECGGVGEKEHGEEEYVKPSLFVGVWDRCMKAWWASESGVALGTPGRPTNA